MNDEKKLTKEMIQGHKLTLNILDSITEYCEPIEKALINTLFKTLTSSQELPTDKEDMDSLHLLWNILQDAKAFKVVRKEILAETQPDISEN